MKLATNHRPSSRRHIARYPPPACNLRRYRDIRATRKTVQHNVPWIATRLNQSTSQRLRLLRRISQTLRIPIDQRRNVNPPVIDGSPLGVVLNASRPTAIRRTPTRGVVRTILTVLNVEDVIIRLRVPIDRVMLPREILPRQPAASIAPHDLITKVTRFEHRIHHLTKIRIRLMVAMQIHSPGPLQHPTNLKHALHHERQVSRKAITVRPPRRQD